MVRAFNLNHKLFDIVLQYYNVRILIFMPCLYRILCYNFSFKLFPTQILQTITYGIFIFFL